MLLQNLQTPEALESELKRVSQTASGIDAAVEQAKEIVSNLQSEFSMTEKDAKLSVLGNIKSSAEEDETTLDEVYAKYPAALKEYIQYTPADLKQNQFVTVLGTTISAVLFIASLAFGVIAVIRATLVIRAFLPAILKMLRNPRQVAELSNLLKVVTIEVGRKVALFGVLMPATSALGWITNAAVNNWNDVFHWGPSFAEQQAAGIFKDLSKLAGGTGYVAQPKTRLTTYKTAKPKLFLGILYAGQVGKYEQFVRQVDDAITSEQDLRDDVQINLVKYISTIDNNLSYAIQIKNSPADELGVPRTGTWATLSIYFTNQFHKRLFLDEILLGPIEPTLYYPETQVVTSVQHEIPKIVDFDTVNIKETLPDKLTIVDAAGNKIADVVPGSGPATPPAAPSGNPANFISNTGKIYPGVLDPQGNFTAWPTLNVGSEGYLEIQSKAGKIMQTPPPTPSAPAPTPEINIITPTLAPQVSLMFPRSVTVVVDVLNVRSAPNTDAPLAGSQKLFRGDTFTIVNYTRGENVQGRDIWWLSEKGNYVWSGGTN